jgi:hypothetical protein
VRRRCDAHEKVRRRCGAHEQVLLLILLYLKGFYISGIFTSVGYAGNVNLMLFRTN